MHYTIITNKNAVLNKILIDWLYAQNYIVYNTHHLDNLDNIYRFDIWQDVLKVFLFSGLSDTIEEVIISL